ncbi:glycosyltransferase [Camelimonas lactis]|uniref:Glycosyltransferase involved in cell wall biosynthesis n=1 Tax=Camelimonas lactis TaxID=659006 RepID=A0A4R2GV30_9HYPH|nr:glycosyltransferase [Camelimonas lactis]TCO12983.1 glycosyltransferase involved in cell wall biosynthesis [Camelimonas lactis]
MTLIPMPATATAAQPGNDNLGVIQAWRAAGWRPHRGLPADQSIALVHDWCPSFRGGERVLAELGRTFGARDLYTLFDFLDSDTRTAHFGGVRFHTSHANRWPGVRKYYRHLFPLCPLLMEQFDVTGHDAVISSSAAFARGVITRPDQPHLCYVHSPVRYAWDEQFSYLEQLRLGNGPKGLLYRVLMHRLRNWDTRTAWGPDVMAANSSYVGARIRRIYGRDAEVVFPPVSAPEDAWSAEKDDYYVTASFMAPYKRTDLVIRAFNAMPRRRLLVVGEGQQAKALRDLAGPNVVFTGFLPRDDYFRTVARARALVFGGCEDFGIALAEAQLLGTPLIAFGRGGAVDIVRSPEDTGDPTGLLFSRQEETAVIGAVEAFETDRGRFTPGACRENADRFSVARFQAGIRRAFAMAEDAARSTTHGAR